MAHDTRVPLRLMQFLHSYASRETLSRPDFSDAKRLVEYAKHGKYITAEPLTPK